MTKKQNNKVVQNIATPLAVIAISLAGTFMIYKGYYNGPKGAKYATIQPAAGQAAVITDEQGNEYQIIDTAEIPVWSAEIAEK